jgi:hypothetical protein
LKGRIAIDYTAKWLDGQMQAAGGCERGLILWTKAATKNRMRYHPFSVERK